MNAIGSLAQFVNELTFDELPDEVVEAAKVRILDVLGTALWGSRRGIQRPFLDTTAQFSAQAESSVIGEADIRLSCLWAAFVNAGMAFSFSDTCRFSGIHPGAVVTPAAFAVGEREMAAGKDLIVAVTVGYEVLTRIGRAVYPGIGERGFHPTGTLGPFGSGAAAGKILKLSEKQVSNALSIAALMGFGLMDSFKESDLIFVQVGKASQSGVLAALLAQSGVKGSGTILEGGFFTGQGGLLGALTDEYHLELLTRDLGRDYAISTVAPKIHGGCRHIHAPIDAITALIDQYRISDEAIEEINLGTYTTAMDMDVHEPCSGDDARFSMPFGVAVAISAGDAFPERFTDEMLNNDRVREIMAKVKVDIDPDIDKVFPEQWGVKAEIAATGKRYSSTLSFPKGEPENSLSKEEIQSKFYRLARPSLGPNNTQKVIELVENLESVDLVSDLTRILASVDKSSPFVS